MCFVCYGANVVEKKEEKIDFYNSAVVLAEFLSLSKAENVVVLDLRQANIWADFFVIATVTSPVHARGLEAQLEERIKEMGLRDYYKKRNYDDGVEWKLLDLGNIVIHLMSKMARDFYDLESLYKNAKKIVIKNNF